MKMKKRQGQSSLHKQSHKKSIPESWVRHVTLWSLEIDPKVSPAEVTMNLGGDDNVLALVKKIYQENPPSPIPTPQVAPIAASTASQVKPPSDPPKKPKRHPSLKNRPSRQNPMKKNLQFRDEKMEFAKALVKENPSTTYYEIEEKLREKFGSSLSQGYLLRIRHEKEAYPILTKKTLLHKPISEVVQSILKSKTFKKLSKPRTKDQLLHVIRRGFQKGSIKNVYQDSEVGTCLYLEKDVLDYLCLYYGGFTAVKPLSPIEEEISVEEDLSVEEVCADTHQFPKEESLGENPPETVAVTRSVGLEILNLTVKDLFSKKLRVFDDDGDETIYRGAQILQISLEDLLSKKIEVIG